MAEWPYGSLEDMNDLEAEWKAWRREERRGDHQGFDLGEGLEVGAFEVMRDLILLEWTLNHPSKTDTGQEGGGGGRTREGSWGRMVFQSVLAQLGDGSGGGNLGEKKEIRGATWSEPVEGREVSHLLKAGDKWELPKARSRTEGLDECVKGK